MAGLIGSIDGYDPSKERWSCASFVSLIGCEMYSLLKNECPPDKPLEIGFENIVRILNEHLEPRPTEIGERFRLSKRHQHEGEAIAEYVADLRRLSVHCRFGANFKISLFSVFEVNVFYRNF